MYADLLSPFWPDAHRLILVEDRDGLLDDESARAELLARGYRLVDDDGDPARLRLAVGNVSGDGRNDYDSDSDNDSDKGGGGGPLVIISRRPANQLPYDYWAAGHRLSLSLAERFPRLNATVLRELSGREQRWRLAQAAPPPAALGRGQTADYLLRAVYGYDPGASVAPAALLAWLARRHDELPGPLPPSLRGRLLERLGGAPALAGWPLAELLDDSAAFGRFVAEQWRGAVGRLIERPLAEPRAAYPLDFAADAALQDVLPGLVRRGALPRLAVAAAESLPGWALPAVMTAADERLAAANDRLARLDEQFAPLAAPAGARWAGWAALAHTWAELTGLALDLKDEPLSAALAARRPALDAAFAAWLRRAYPALAGQKLPQPHHVHHAPHWLAQERRAHGRPVCLLVLDGLSLADWLRVGRVWQARHPGWRLAECGPLLAQIPTITAVSRQALISGRPPRDFAATLGDNRHEAAQWAAFWAAEGLAGRAVAYARLTPGEPLPPAAQALCLVTTGLDSRLHGATLGAAEAWASLGVWLGGAGRAVEAAIEALLAAGYAVYVGSDHGHTEAWGIGRPREGETAESRGQRSRLYRAAETAAAQRAKYPATTIWPPDGVLPDGLWALLPTDQPARGAFAPLYQAVVAHGGLTLDEVVVPLALIREE